MSNVKPKLIRLHRSKRYRMIAGVFGGLAEYMGWSPALFRWLFVLSIPLTATVTLFGGILFYLIAWMVMPEATEQSYIYQ
ncbi:PspC domain-containing protein [Moraxella oblonga]|uniref:PspC domain-containing protein n=1 Tax=Moraxella oblonga TaxID=200413 RepID=UPI0008306771|nr:PspC domain-containing protein [Moraxella oblonga]